MEKKDEKKGQDFDKTRVKAAFYKHQSSVLCFLDGLEIGTRTNGSSDAVFSWLKQELVRMENCFESVFARINDKEE